MDTIRNLLIWLEERPEASTFRAKVPNEFGDDKEVAKAHLQMLESGGFVDRSKYHVWISWEGYEFLDKIRDPEIWRKTKDGASKLNSWGVKILGDLASGYLRAKAAELGLPIL